MSDKVENTIDKKAAADASIEAVIAESAGAESSEKQKKTSKATSKATSKKSSNTGVYIVAFILLIAAILGGLKLTGQLQPLYASLISSVATESADVVEPVERLVPQAVIPQAETLNTSAQLEHSQPMTSAVSSDVPSDVQNQPADVAPNEMAAAIPAVSDAAINELLLSIDSLRSTLSQLEESQQTLQQRLLEQQRMNRQVRLRWIADSDSRLAQMQLAWEEISLLPGLNEQQRQQAVEMHTLARTNVLRLYQWQGNLKKWAEVLSTPVHENVLPTPEQPWLAWIVGQFQLRHAPSQEARRLSDLRGRLLDSARQLTLQTWPDQSAWQRLHAELLLQIKSMQAGDAKVEIGLPVDFEGIQTDINTLRETARQWSSDVEQSNVQQGGML
ncbi:hypothetical protein D8Y20_07660 [Mariprofundus sp. EBB-1]|uniref:hypothetical protein n=1 Tax=Mariprofundus sp. EBB-1 TaxID=2650971 RepID=UPI000EF20AFB|nr:hypothetical protein [Mariprofundus sp. EBB-1]RLL52156.1 hypothetical protein D8Y20_07660 [Mariprofundus sp. EBB-1]